MFVFRPYFKFEATNLIFSVLYERKLDNMIWDDTIEAPRRNFNFIVGLCDPFIQRCPRSSVRSIRCVSSVFSFSCTKKLLFLLGAVVEAAGSRKGRTRCAPLCNGVMLPRTNHRPVPDLTSAQINILVPVHWPGAQSEASIQVTWSLSANQRPVPVHWPCAQPSQIIDNLQLSDEFSSSCAVALFEPTYFTRSVVWTFLRTVANYLIGLSAQKFISWLHIWLSVLYHLCQAWVYIFPSASGGAAF